MQDKNFKHLNDMITDWQYQMQDMLQDPRVAELMTEYYAKLQKNIESFSDSFIKQKEDDNTRNTADVADIPSQLAELKGRVQLLEGILANILKGSLS